MVTPHHMLTGAILYGSIAHQLGAPDVVVGAAAALGAVLFAFPDVHDWINARMGLDTRYRIGGSYNQWHHPIANRKWWLLAIEILTGIVLHVGPDPICHEWNKFTKWSFWWCAQWLAGEAVLGAFNYGLFLLMR